MTTALERPDDDDDGSFVPVRMGGGADQDCPAWATAGTRSKKQVEAFSRFYGEYLTRLVAYLVHQGASVDVAGVRVGALAGRGFADDYARVLAADVARAFARLVGRLLDLDNVEGLAAALLDGALDDFTHADLTAVSLADVDLTGIQWSNSTRWPPGTDVDAMRSESRETSPNSGVYVYGPPSGGTDRDPSNVRL